MIHPEIVFDEAVGFHANADQIVGAKEDRGLVLWSET